MFDKKPKSYTDLLGKTNRIVEGTIIKGNILSHADFRLDGDIEGKFEGKIQVAEVLNIKAKAIIHGEVVCAKLAVEPGAEFSATCIMKTNTKVPAHDEQPKPEQAEQQ